MLKNRNQLAWLVRLLFLIATSAYILDSLIASQSFTNNPPYELVVAIHPVNVPNCTPIDLRRLAKQRTTIDGRLYPHQLALSYNDSVNVACLNRTTLRHRILVWNRFFATQHFIDGHDELAAGNCPVTNCDITHDKATLNASHVVYVHMADQLAHKLPRHKPHDQRWVFGVYESPANVRDLSAYDAYFNLTSTYNARSDFPNFYQNKFDEHFVWRRNASFVRGFDYAARKSGLAFALVSNCLAPSRRLEYFERMRTFVPVNVYGACGEPCPSDDEIECRAQLSAKYKFYLAFENSVCEEYVTEKFFQMLRYDVVPVVFGGGDYALHIPPSGFINAMNYRTFAELTDYLKYLDSDNSAYNAYFTWKAHISLRTKGAIKEPFVTFCDICIRLNLEQFYGIKHKVVDNLKQIYSKKSSCSSVEITRSDHQCKLGPYHTVQ